MKRNRFTDEQIIGILKEHEAGTPVSELCRKHGVSDASIYKWKAKFGGMDVSEAKRLKTLEDENAKLKRLLADAMLDDLRPDFPPNFGRVLGFLLWDQTLDRRKLEFSGSDHDGWLVAPPGLCRAIGTLYPTAE